MKLDDLIIHTEKDLADAVEEFGFLPFFGNSVHGFSIEEHISPDCWYTSSDGSWKAWEWKGPVIKRTGCAYGKFFEHKAAYVSREWFPDLANHRRDGYDFDARYDDGLARYSDKVLYGLIDENAPVISKTLKKLGDYRKGGCKGFESAITRLQHQCYVTITDFVYMRDRNGQRYGWGVAEYSTPEKAFGTDFKDSVYIREPQESYERISAHLKKLIPDITDEQIRRFLG